MKCPGIEITNLQYIHRNVVFFLHIDVYPDLFRYRCFYVDVKGGIVLDPFWIVFSFWMLGAESDWCLLWYTGISCIETHLPSQNPGNQR